MPFGGLLTIAIIGAATSAAGDIAASKSSSSSTTPNESPAAASIQNLVNQQIMNRLQGSPTGLPPGYQASGIQGINQAFTGANTNENAALTARGLSASPVAATVTNQSNMARAGQIGNFNASLPIVAQQLQNQNLQLAQGIIQPQTGVTSSGTQTAGGGAAGAAGGLAGYLGYLQGKGAFGTQQPGYPNAPGAYVPQGPELEGDNVGIYG